MSQLQIQSEKPRRYYRGGFCPIEIGDRIEDRFTILHKLGFGRFETVWLARDDEKRHGRYVALKIVSADRSEDYLPAAVIERLQNFEADNGFPGIFVFEFEHFFYTSRNGRHLCQVPPVLGPTLASLNKWAEGSDDAHHFLYPSFVKDFAQQLTSILGTMHSLGVCHGNVTIKNIAIRLDKSLDSLTEQQLAEIFAKTRTKEQAGSASYFGKPRRDESINWYFRNMEQSPAPSYAVESVDLTLLPPAYLSSRICIFDYDRAFLTEDPPRKLPFIERWYLAPESIFTLTNEPAADIWALGVILYYLRRPFLLFGDCDPESTCIDMSWELGPFPEAWRKLRFIKGFPVHDPMDMEPGESNFSHDEDIPKARSLSTIDYHHHPNEVHAHQGRLEGTVNEIRIPRRPEYAVDDKHDGLAKFCRIIEPLGPYHSTEQVDKPEVVNTMPIRKEDAALFYDLLQKVFVYDHTIRLTAHQVLEHPWFRYMETERQGPVRKSKEPRW